MNRKLLMLDLLLACAVIYGGFQLHSHWTAAKTRQSTVPGPAVTPAPPPPVQPLPSQPAVLPSGYKAIAINTLFDPSRNPDIPVPPPPAPPPDPVPPPPPSYHGSMDIGQGPVALLTEDGDTRYQEVHVGGMIGAFKLVSFNRQEIELDWNGKIIHRRKGEDSAARPSRGRGAARAEPAFAPDVIPGRAPEQPTPQPQNQGQDLGPGPQMTDTVRACQAGDSSPAGKVTDGYKKELNVNPLGTQCIWRAVGR